MRIDEKRLAEIEARANAANPGPWELHTGYEPWEISVNGTVPEPCHHDPPQDSYSICFQTCHDYTFDQIRPTYEFVAHSRTDIPDLVADLREALAKIEKLERICGESYQVLGALAYAFGGIDKAGVEKALDNLSQQEIVHEDVLPFELPE